MSLSRHLIANSLLLLTAIVTGVYLQPYSLHQVIATDYAQFDQPPAEDGRVNYSSGLPVDFRLPQLTLSAAAKSEIRGSSAVAAGTADSEDIQIAGLVQVIRSRLNRDDTALPSADILDAGQLYDRGRACYSLCSDYSRLLNEALQAAGFVSRIVWMEGHVVTEYFSHRFHKWVMLDAHRNLRAESPSGTPLSIAQLIFTVERQRPVVWAPVCEVEATAANLPHDDTEVWYRNILLNGECYVLSGTTLTARGRWNQLLYYGSRPQVVSLTTAFDTSPSRFHGSLRLRAIAVLQLTLVACFYSGRAVRHRQAGSRAIETQSASEPRSWTTGPN